MGTRLKASTSMFPFLCFFFLSFLFLSDMVVIRYSIFVSNAPKDPRVSRSNGSSPTLTREYGRSGAESLRSWIVEVGRKVRSGQSAKVPTVVPDRFQLHEFLFCATIRICNSFWVVLGASVLVCDVTYGQVYETLSISFEGISRSAPPLAFIDVLFLRRDNPRNSRPKSLSSAHDDHPTDKAQTSPPTNSDATPRSKRLHKNSSQTVTHLPLGIP